MNLGLLKSVFNHAESTVIWVLLGLFALIVVISIIQLLRIVHNVPEFSWTTQKIFLFLCFLTCSVRVAFFAVVQKSDVNIFMVNFRDHPLSTVLDTFPVILFFTTYTLLILFWSEIIFVAQNSEESTIQKAHWAFGTSNFLAYSVLFILWLLLFLLPHKKQSLDIVINIYLAFLVIFAACGFIYFGGRLFFMLKQFPINTTSRTNKLREVFLSSLDLLLN
eukprot:TRINITY_DN8997_c0_g1_i2.p1 TRINITY_DN8997_c0_g1~~TRINITY_DN8997_c0_g1_i2.p1  ORF type:complete len:220 (+),score=33.92 TRINITY_DN8997_c0_g1_i2:123-782(+)